MYGLLNNSSSGYVVLNETCIDKGPSGSCCTLDTYCGDQIITTVTGDG